jgi:Domain of unknown function DUF1828
MIPRSKPRQLPNGHTIFVLLAISMPNSISDFATQYAHWLTSRLTATAKNEITEISTPFLDPLNDGMRVYIELTKNGFLLHDGGLTLETLSLHGVDIKTSAKRRSLTETMLKSSGLTINNERIETSANHSNFPQRMHFLLSAMHRISDLWLTVRTLSVPI